MVKIRSNLAEFSNSRLRRILADLPRAKGYRLTVKPLRYRTSPHLQAECDYESKTITVQVPEPFRPFRQRIPYRAKRIKSRRQRGNAFAFRSSTSAEPFRVRKRLLRRCAPRND